MSVASCSNGVFPIFVGSICKNDQMGRKVP